MNKCSLIITSHYPPNIGGVESHLQALIEALRKKEWSLIISTYQPLASKVKAFRVEKSRGLIIYRMPWPGFNLVHLLFRFPALEFLYLFPGLFLITLQILFKHRKDINIIHCQGLVPTAIGLILGRLFSRKVISSTHNLYFFSKNGLYATVAKIVFSSVDWVLTPTQVAKEELMKIGVSGDKISIFRYWVDLKKFSPVDKKKAKKRLGWGELTVFFVGRLIETKGVGVLLEVIKRAKGNINFVIAGTGPFEKAIKQVTREYPNLKYLGRIENQKLPVYYSAADLVIVPSLVDEGFGFVVMESIACGTPVLAANRGGLADAVSGNTGKLFEPTTEEMQKSVNNLFSNHMLLKKMTQNCRKYALNNFSERNIEDILKVYEN